MRLNARVTRLALAAGATTLVSSAAAGQTRTPIAPATISVVSDLRPDWLNDGAESPDGRFYILGSYTSNDSGFVRYDRATKTWALVHSGRIGDNAHWSPDGRFLAYTLYTQEPVGIHIWILPMNPATGVASGPPHRVTLRSARSLAWSPDGRRIVFSSIDSTGVSFISIPFNGGDEELLYHGKGNGGGVVWSPDGKSVYAWYAGPTEQPSTIRIDVVTRSMKKLALAAGPIVAISPDGKWLAEHERYKDLVFASAVDGRQVKRVALSPGVNPVQWRHGSSNEMVGLEHITPAAIQRVSLADGRITSVSPVDSFQITDPAISPDQRRMAYASRTEAGVYRLFLADVDGTNRRMIADDAAAPHWSPDGKYIAFSRRAGNLEIVDVSSGARRELLHAEPGDDQGRLVAAPVRGLSPAIHWRNDGKAVQYFERRASDPTTLEIREVGVDGQDRRLLGTKLGGRASFIAGIDTLALLWRGGEIELVNLRTSAAHKLLSGVRTRIDFDEDVPSDGRVIALAVDDSAAVGELNETPATIDLANGSIKRYPYTLGSEVASVWLHPDGQHVVVSACPTCSNGREKWDIILVSAKGEAPRILTAPEASYHDFGIPVVSRDGKYVYFEAEQSYNTRLVTITLPKLP